MTDQEMQLAIETTIGRKGDYIHDHNAMFEAINGLSLFELSNYDGWLMQEIISYSQQIGIEAWGWRKIFSNPPCHLKARAYLRALKLFKK